MDKKEEAVEASEQDEVEDLEELEEEDVEEDVEDDDEEDEEDVPKLSLEQRRQARVEWDPEVIRHQTSFLARIH